MPWLERRFPAKKPGSPPVQSVMRGPFTSEEETGLARDRRIDGGVIESGRRGDREALRLIFDQYKDQVYSTALYYFRGQESSARDVTQKVFLAVLTRLEAFRGASELSTWLYRVTINACVDEQRKQRRYRPIEEDPGREERPSLAEPVDSSMEKEEKRLAIRSAVASLNPKIKAAVLLRYFSDLSYEEMAEALGCSAGTVASRLNRGHRILARKLGHLRPRGAFEE